MKLIRPLMGRRQFLIGSVAASVTGMVARKITGMFHPGSLGGIAGAAEAEAATDISTREAFLSASENTRWGGDSRIIGTVECR